MKQINLDAPRLEAEIIVQIARRAVELARKHGIEYDAIEADMDITACHLNGCPLKMAELLAADDFNFSHDVFGIRSHLNRETGKLEDCFLPRFTNTTNKAAMAFAGLV